LVLNARNRIALTSPGNKMPLLRQLNGRLMFSMMVSLGNARGVAHPGGADHPSWPTAARTPAANG